MLMTINTVRFEEIQRFRQPWIIIVTFSIALLTWAGFVRQIIMGIPFGQNPAPDYLMVILTALFGIAMPLFILGYRMKTTLTPDFIVIEMTLLGRHLIKIEDISKCYFREYRPIMEYGGWGWRWSPKWGKAYNVSGRKGVQLKLENGKKILIGSRNPEKLAAEINALL